MTYRWKSAGKSHFELHADGVLIGSVESEERAEWLGYPLWDDSKPLFSSTERDAKASLIRAHQAYVEDRS